MSDVENPTSKLLFISADNGDAAQMAAALAKQIGGDAVDVTAATPNLEGTLREDWHDALEAAGADPASIIKESLDDDMVRSADRIALIGDGAELGDVDGLEAEVEEWEVELPGEGPESAREFRDRIAQRVIDMVLVATGQPVSHAKQYLRIIGELAEKYEDTFSYDEVRAFVRKAHAELAPTTKAPNHLPVFVERLAEESLRDAAKVKGAPMDDRRDVLFVSGNGSGLTRVAAEMARHYSNGLVNGRSAGVDSDGELNDLLRASLDERGIQYGFVHPEELDDEAVKLADALVVIGDAERIEHEGNRYEHWDVAEPDDEQGVRNAVDELEGRVKRLLDALGATPQE